MEDSHKAIVEECKGDHDSQEIDPSFDNPREGLIVIVHTHGFHLCTRFVIWSTFVEEARKIVVAAVVLLLLLLSGLLS